MVVFTVNVETILPVDVTVVGEKLHVASLGRPEQVKFTAAVGVNPFCGVNVIVSVPLLPAVTGSDAEETLSEKSGVVGPVPEPVMALDWFEAVDAPSPSTASTT
jgi:hypothetical protein